MCRYVTGTEWVSGCYDGSVALWSQTKKKPISRSKAAHAPGAPPSDSAADAPVDGGGGGGAGCPEGATAAWVQSVAVCPGADLVV